MAARVQREPARALEARRKALEYVKTRIFDYADYLEDRLTDTASDASYSTAATSEASFAPSEASVAYSEASVAYSEASTVYTDDGDWPELSQ